MTNSRYKHVPNNRAIRTLLTNGQAKQARDQLFYCVKTKPVNLAIRCLTLAGSMAEDGDLDDLDELIKLLEKM